MTTYDDLKQNPNNIQTTETFSSNNTLESEFLKTFNNLPIADLKQLIKLDPKNDKVFNYIFNNKKVVDNSLVSTSKSITNSNSLKEKIDYLIDFVEKNCYKIITGKTFLEVLKLFTSEQDLLSLSESEVNDVLYDVFGKYQIDLEDPNEKVSFKDFIWTTIQ